MSDDLAEVAVHILQGSHHDSEVASHLHVDPGGEVPLLEALEGADQQTPADVRLDVEGDHAIHREGRGAGNPGVREG